jgi:hypothetical protein
MYDYRKRKRGKKNYGLNKLVIIRYLQAGMFEAKSSD